MEYDTAIVSMRRSRGQRTRVASEKTYASADPGSETILVYSRWRDAVAPATIVWRTASERRKPETGNGPV
jgi:hypothetical protein